MRIRNGSATAAAAPLIDFPPPSCSLNFFPRNVATRARSLSLECWYLKSTSADYMTARVYEMRAPGELFERESRDFYLRKISLKNFLRIMNEVSE